ncbi:unnamed protein product [Cylicostephanus goldi]|uniref:Uncharacterized protein n=1 Tax=Cylicostephanus goldi TaxID=71465 RepID=A0A3P6RF26_CYLGO|nr:unnamed protein product [Cylicostephanus goldi]
MCFRQELNEVAEDMYYLNRTLPVLHEQREFMTLREQEMQTEQLIIAYLVRGEVRETIFRIKNDQTMHVKIYLYGGVGNERVFQCQMHTVSGFPVSNIPGLC